MSSQPLEPIVALHKLMQTLDNTFQTTYGVVISERPVWNTFTPWFIYTAQNNIVSKEGRRLGKALIEARKSLEEFGVKP